MSDPTIPPPSGLDLGLDLSRAYLTSGLLPPPGGEVAASLIRRCHAAESERDRLSASAAARQARRTTRRVPGPSVGVASVLPGVRNPDADHGRAVCS